MKLQKIRVDHFGKLEDFSMDLSDGMNRFCYPNEFGKSTLMAFIYFIFYGYDSKWMKSYFPWKGGPLSGSITFSLEGKEWQIFRHHPQKGAERQQVMDLTAGKELVMAVKEKPGPKLLGLDGETFMRTFFVRQGDLFFDRTDGLDTALKNLAATGDENASFSQAMELLTKEHNRYCYTTRKMGPLIDLKNALLEKKVELSRLEQAIDGQIAKKQEMDGLERQKAALEAELLGLEKRMVQAKKNDAARKLLALEEQQEAAAPRSEAEDITLAKQEQAFERLEEAKGQITNQRERAEQLSRERQNEQHRLEAFYLPAETKEKLEHLEKGDGKNTLFGILFLAMGIGCAIGGFLMNLLWIGSGIFAAIGLFFLLRPSMMSRQLCRHCGVADLKGLRERWEQYEGAKGRLASLEEEVAQADALQKELESRLASEQAALQALILETRLLTLEELKKEQFNRAVWQQTAANSRRQQQELLQGRTIEEWQAEAQGGDPEGERYEPLFLKKQEALSRLSRLMEALDQKDLYQLSALWKEAETLRAEISADERRKQEWETALAAVRHTMDWLREANEDMSLYFAPRLCKKAGELLSCLTDGAYDTVQMDEQYDIRLETAAGSYPTASFSRGTKDAVYFAFRLAVGELISPIALPLMLDDPFVNLDDERLSLAEELLEKGAKKRQILYFTCSDR